MKTIFAALLCMSSQVKAQTPVDTARIFKDTVKSAWSKQPDTTSRPLPMAPLAAPPVPPVQTNPINNPASGQTHQPPYPQQQPAEQKTNKQPAKVTPVRPTNKPLQYDTLPGTKRNG